MQSQQPRQIQEAPRSKLLVGLSQEGLCRELVVGQDSDQGVEGMVLLVPFPGTLLAWRGFPRSTCLGLVVVVGELAVVVREILIADSGILKKLAILFGDVSVEGWRWGATWCRREASCARFARH